MAYLNHFGYIDKCPFHPAGGALHAEASEVVPEGGEERRVDGVAVVDVEVVPAALGGKVVETQPQDCVGPKKNTQTHTEFSQVCTALSPLGPITSSFAATQFV